MTLSFGKRDRYQRVRVRASLPESSSTVQPRYSLLIGILLAFAAGFLTGRHDNTPKKMSAAFSQLSDAVGKRNEYSIDKLLGEITKKRFQLESSLRRDYGDYYGKLFDPIQIRKNIFLASSISRERLKRRLIRKILQKLIDPSATVNFIWATGGDSSAAAHGNLFNQSYTAVLERTIQPAFEALGINFISRNFAMSWYHSAPELSLCMEEVYGTDVDILNWDFAMQEGYEKTFRTEFWIQRGLVHSSFPILFFIDDRSSQRFELIEQKLSSDGFIFMDKPAVDFVRSRVPSKTNSSSEFPLIHNWICEGGAIEGNVVCDDPVRFNMCEQHDTAEECLLDKFNTQPGCDRDRKPNHPGWKEHFFKGTLIAHFLLDALEEALINLDAMKYPNGQRTAIRSQVLLEQLDRLHLMEIKNATSKPVPESYEGFNNTILQHFSLETLFRGDTICHTALLPAQIRFLGILTGSGVVGTVDGGYDTGKNKALEEKSEDNQLPLVYEPSDRTNGCPSTKADHKDFFHVRDTDDWLHTVVPNEAEIRAYRRKPPQGIILLCLQRCPWDKCTDDFVGFGQLTSTHGNAKIEIQVDGQEVKNVISVDHHCHVLEGAKGIKWGLGRGGKGQYKLSFRLQVRDPGLKFSVKISSIILL